ncbi:non-ribosomal peptide synthetase [Fumia xinanensis]|uniref:Non-ribosomal peptide synthetase n=1 Tax=Fumia xinanensis TaxID=2763659 RepID=A0A926E6Z2_9FIRM|nr:non-ribosomal peptide synthetase [Fumia xinanensis]MBC8560733.1 non-ribosomal peptide synthetase [Fumia xinanensis]
MIFSSRFFSKIEEGPLVKDNLFFSIEKKMIDQVMKACNFSYSGDTHSTEICLRALLVILINLSDDSYKSLNYVDSLYPDKIQVCNYTINDDDTLRQCIYKLVSEKSSQIYSIDKLFNGEKGGEFSFICGTHCKETFLPLAYSNYNDILLNFEILNNKVELQVIYSINKILTAELTAFILNYLELLKIFLSNPDIVLKTVSFNCTNYYEKLQLVTGQENIIDEFHKTVLLYSDKIALADSNEKYTYAELDKISSCIATRILSQYSLSTKRIGLYMARTSDFIICMLAVLKTGCAYVPIDEHLPVDRVCYIVNDSDVDLIITNISNIPIDVSIPICEFQKIKTNIDEESILTHQKVAPGDLAYLIYTSGTTGRPKGVMISHCSVVNLKYHFVWDLKVDCSDVVGQFASIAFDASISEIFMALFTGATLYIIDDLQIYNIELFYKCLNDNQITVLTLPPAYICNLDFDRIHTIKVLLSAGSACPPYLVDKVSKNIDFINAYGPTECTVCATTWHRKNRSLYNNIPLGKAIPNVNVYIIGKNNQLLPPMMIGEICIGGISVGEGYYKMPAQTEKNFIHTLFSVEEKIYRTGDIGKMLPDRNIEFIGRRDNQVKLNGFRIELNEIINELLNINGIVDAYATIIHKGDRDYICAYYISMLQDLQPDRIKQMLKLMLPSYEIPHFILSLDKMPLNNSGKISRDLLPLPESFEICSPESTDQYPEEYALILQSIPVQHIDKSKSFFDLGGDSITAISLITKIYNVYGIQLSIQDFYNDLQSLCNLFCDRREKNDNAGNT